MACDDTRGQFRAEAMPVVIATRRTSSFTRSENACPPGCKYRYSKRCVQRAMLRASRVEEPSGLTPSMNDLSSSFLSASKAPLRLYPSTRSSGLGVMTASLPRPFIVVDRLILRENRMFAIQIREMVTIVGMDGMLVWSLAMWNPRCLLCRRRRAAKDQAPPASSPLSPFNSKDEQAASDLGELAKRHDLQ